MKKFLFLTFIMGCIALPTLAFDSSEVVNNQPSSDIKAYSSDFDILVLDVIVPDNTGEADILNALTVNNTRNANNADIDKVILWSDNGDDKWQGYMVDVELAEGVRVDTRKWEFTDLGLDIPVGGLHLYVSVETSNSVTTNRKIQFEIDQLSDANILGSFDSNDRGIFVESDNDGPVGGSVVSGQVYRLENRTNDILPPKVNITNIADGDSYEVVDSFVIEGVAKDRQQGSPKWLRVSVVPTGHTVDWQEAIALTTNYATWNYSVTGLAAGSYNVQTNVSDWDYNTEISDIMTITLTAPVVEPNPTPEPEIPPADPGEWVGTLIKTDSSPRVYLLKEGTRYWFYNEAIFYQYYTDFSNVELIDDNTMASYQEGKDMPMKAGSLIKRIISNKVYETGANWEIRWIPSEQEAIELYGSDWANKINLIPDRYFNQYSIVENL